MREENFHVRKEDENPLQSPLAVNSLLAHEVFHEEKKISLCSQCMLDVMRRNVLYYLLSLAFTFDCVELGKIVKIFSRSLAKASPNQFFTDRQRH